MVEVGLLCFGVRQNFFHDAFHIKLISSSKQHEFEAFQLQFSQKLFNAGSHINFCLFRRTFRNLDFRNFRVGFSFFHGLVRFREDLGVDEGLVEVEDERFVVFETCGKLVAFVEFRLIFLYLNEFVHGRVAR